ncbi:MAG TPA: hypothetical protein VGL14_12775 [Methylomirabilota bacterium]|jgi:hypothetical protein
MNQHLEARIRDIRAGLPGQLRQQRLRTASLVFGPLYSLDQIHRRIARTLPFRLGSVRRLRVTPIEQAEIIIPEDVLLRYDEAAQAGVFARFLVGTPAYYWRPAGDAWLVAEVAGTERWAVLAHWTAAQSVDGETP